MEAVLVFAKEAISSFQSDLKDAAARANAFENAFLLMSSDKVTLGDPPHVYGDHTRGSKTRKIGRFLSFEHTLTAQSAVELFGQSDDDDVQTYLMMTLISLRQIEIEGSSPMGNYTLDSAYEQLKSALARALGARRAA
ncbi:hypothetical protein GHK58_17045 [Sinorhizobium meliloti]|nr:hypothetical protein [Sinorhizobium meliloti]